MLGKILYSQSVSLKTVFTSDRVVVRVVIRGTELYDLVKINAMELEAEA